MFLRVVVDATGQSADGTLFSEATKRHPHRAGVFFHAGKVTRSEYPTLAVAIYRVKYLTDRAMWLCCHGMMLKKQGSFFNTNHSIDRCFSTKQLSRFKLLAWFVFALSKVRQPSFPSDLLVRGLVGSVVGAW